MVSGYLQIGRMYNAFNKGNIKIMACTILGAFQEKDSVYQSSITGLKGCKMLNKDSDPTNSLEGKEVGMWSLFGIYRLSLP